MAASTIRGDKKASVIARLTCRTLHRYRSAISCAGVRCQRRVHQAIVVPVQWRDKLGAGFRTDRAISDRCFDLAGMTISRAALAGGFCPGNPDDDWARCRRPAAIRVTVRAGVCRAALMGSLTRHRHDQVAHLNIYPPQIGSNKTFCRRACPSQTWASCWRLPAW